ncbi:hypothetical protein [Microbacterium deminutum]|uniref:Uncharacterized protein n=1 Tax=Microbacterium deminutum TaxID=344164 RepID=A0ABP5CBA8_9MICO
MPDPASGIDGTATHVVVSAPKSAGIHLPIDRIKAQLEHDEQVKSASQTPKVTATPHDLQLVIDDPPVAQAAHAKTGSIRERVL